LQPASPGHCEVAHLRHGSVIVQSRRDSQGAESSTDFGCSGAVEIALQSNENRYEAKARGSVGAKYL
jgi:hypothetical protein